MYEKLMAVPSCNRKRMDGKEVCKTMHKRTFDIGTESKIEKFTFDGKLNYKSLEYGIETFVFNNPIKFLGLEDGFDFAGDDAPADDTGGDDSGGFDFGGSDDSSSGGDDSGSFDFGGGDDSSGGGFDFDSASDDSGDFFGSDDSDGGDDKKKAKEIVLNRDEALDENYSIDKNIRKIFPQRFLELKDTISGNINIIEKAILNDEEYMDVLDGILEEYNYMNDMIDKFIDVITEKPYEEIFATYVTIHNSLTRLKKLYVSIVQKSDK